MNGASATKPAPLNATLAEALRRVADVLEQLPAPEPAGPRLVTTREPEELLTIDQAAALLQVDKSTVHRMARRHPRVKRYAGTRVRYERGELLRATRRG